jgi:CRP-like cAMP-binding protein
MAETVYRNRILARLRPEDRELLVPHLVPVELEQRQRIATANQPIGHAYFVEDGIVSTATAIRHDVGVEIGIIGREGLANIALAMGTDRAPHDSFMQIGGHGLAITAGALEDALQTSRTLNRALLCYAHVYLMQLAGTVLANGRASVTERLARWLLMAQDRIDGDLPLTHGFLAVMLGVRRAGVTVALKDLERLGLVSGRRGAITILDRRGLEEQANGYYGIPESEMRRLFGDGPFGADG